MLRALIVLLLMAWTAAGARAEVAEVTIPADGIALRARLVRPASAPIRAPVVALHGCGGPFPSRDRQWAEILTGAGYPVLFPDSFGSRGLGSQCKVTDRQVRPGRERRADTVAAVQWLESERLSPVGGAFVMGWSNGGSTVLAAAAQGVIPQGAVRGFVAFYPGCRIDATRADWAPSA
ncbi:MAG: prolyl oligopeptidase family serine peptidase, partial [Acetobacteraceae bacterium]|nr:prolyl oligopeptidase family serine peptidase [Acetobacteraceae bacterium]